MQRESSVANNGIPLSRISSSPFNDDDAHLAEYENNTRKRIRTKLNSSRKKKEIKIVKLSLF
jgi:hypothetical protein